MVNLKRKLKNMLHTEDGRSKLSNVLSIEWNGNKTPLVAPRSPQEASEGVARYTRMSNVLDDEEMQPLTGVQPKRLHRR